MFCKSLSAPGVTVTPTGKISSCQRDGAPDYFHYGYIDSEKKKIVVDYDKIKEFRKMDVRAYPECQNCHASLLHEFVLVNPHCLLLEGKV